VLDEPANGLDPAGIRDMRALVKRLAESGLTVLLSSHDMIEVEEICNNVTIMRTGKVVYHGGIDELRRRAPAQGHRIAAAAGDDALLALAQGAPGLEAGRDPEGGVIVHGEQAAINDLVAKVVSSAVELQRLEQTETPLESLFFMLTETHPHQPDELVHLEEAAR
jgi:ABC-2 type transport system ATP-binding protein